MKGGGVGTKFVLKYLKRSIQSPIIASVKIFQTPIMSMKPNGDKSADHLHGLYSPLIPHLRVYHSLDMSGQLKNDLPTIQKLQLFNVFTFFCKIMAPYKYFMFWCITPCPCNQRCHCFARQKRSREHPARLASSSSRWH
jgi:hypothetical protein